MSLDVQVSELVGQTIKEIKGKVGDDRLEFHMQDGKVYEMYDAHDCCASVTLEDVCGDLNDLLGTPVVKFEESTNSKENPPGVTKEYQESFTWTFYHLSTIKGTVTLRWYGQSNGYHSESVYFRRVE